MTVQVSDGTNTDTQAIAVTVTNVNDSAPVITSNGGGTTASVSVAENTTAVTTVTATDADGALNTLTYSISGGADAAKFSIDPSTGVLTFVSAPNFEAPTDAGANNVYDVTVQVSDGTNTDTQAIAITVTNVNDNAPVITSNGGGTTASVSVAENATAVTTVTATDADGALNALTYSISGGADAAKFSINASTGALTFVSAPDFEAPTDAGANNVYDVTVQVSDGTNIDTQAIAVTVTNVNEAPVFAGTTLTLVSNAGSSTNVNFTEAALASYFTDPEGSAIGINALAILSSSLDTASGTNLGTGSVGTVGTITINDNTTLGGSFSMTATDGSLISSPATTVTFTNNSTGTATLNAAASGDSIIVASQTSGAVLNGGAGNDYLIGNNGSDLMSGGGGNDTLIGGAGGDDMTGGAGIDTFIINAGSAAIEDLGTGGADIMNVSGSVSTVFVTVTAAYTATAATTNTTSSNTVVELTTSDFAVDLSLASGTTGYMVANDGINGTTITGSAFSDILIGGTGSDSLVGGAGNDTIRGGTSDTLLDGGTGTDTLEVNAQSFFSTSDAQIVNIENVTITVGAAVTVDLSNQTEGFTITGNIGKDSITGGSGNDTIIGGLGGDTLTGGAGTDTFNFAAGDSVLTIGGSGTSGTIAGYDVITDYTSGSTVATSEKLGFTGAAIVANTAGVDGTNSTLLLNTGVAVSSHSITNGIITFDDANTFSAPVSLTSLADVAAVVQYLQANDIGTTGSSVAFVATISGFPHTFVYTQGSTGTSTTTNELIDLQNVAATSISTSGLTNQLAVIQDTTPPTVISEAITSATGIQNSTLNAGDVVSVTVQMSKVVFVAGTPQLALNIGGTTVQADYFSGSGSTALVFHYTILAGQTDTNGISIDANALSVNGGAIQDVFGSDATLTAGAVTDNSGFKVDTTAPGAPSTPDLLAATDSGSSNTDNITNDTTPTFTGTAEAGSTVTIFDGVTAVGSVVASGGTYSITTSALSQGVHSITATATDPAGNISIASGALSITIDTTEAAPGTPVLLAASDSGSSNSDRITNVTTPTFTGTGVDGDTVTIFDGSTAVGSAVVSGGTYSITTSALSQGVHSITAKQTDAAGNTSSASSALSVTIDTTASAPVISGFTSDSGATGDHITNDTTLTINGTAEVGATVTVFRDGVSIGTAVANGSGAWSVADAATLADATTYQYTAQQTDVAGNTSVVSANYAATIDTTVPGAPSTPDLLTASDSGSSSTDDITKTTTPTFTGTAEIGSTVKLFDGVTQIGSGVANGSGNWSIVSSTLSQGVHSITATATDVAGNTGVASGALSVTIDTTASAPVISGFSTDSGTVGDHITNDTTLTINGTAEIGATVTVLRNGVSIGTVVADGSGNWSKVDATTLTNGTTYQYTAQQTDVAGNTSAVSANYAATIDTTASAPVISGFTSDSGTVGDHITNDTTLTINGTAEIGATVTVFRDGVSIGTAVANGSGAWSVADATTLTDGTTYQYSAQQTDVAGNTSAVSSNYAATIDTSAPSITSGATGTEAENTVATNVVYTAAATDNSTVTYSLTGTDAALFNISSSTGAVTFKNSPNFEAPTDSGANNVYDIVVNATDVAGNVATKAVAITVTNVNDAPVATITSATYAATGQTSLTLKGTGLSISDEDAGSGSMTVTLSVVEGTLTATAGNSGASVSGSATSSLTITGTVTQVNAFLGASSTSTLTYIDNNANPSPSTVLTLLVHDNGNTGGGDLSASDTATINITKLNHAPVGVADNLSSTARAVHRLHCRIRGWWRTTRMPMAIRSTSALWPTAPM